MVGPDSTAGVVLIQRERLFPTVVPREIVSARCGLSIPKIVAMLRP